MRTIYRSKGGLTMGMTVQELIDELMKVEDKTLPIISEEERFIIGFHEYENEFVKLYEHD